MNPITSHPVLVTGASGYIAQHCVLQLLQNGYIVRGTLRDLNRADHLRKVLARHTAGLERLKYVQAELMEDDGWADAVAGCEYVLHVASPFPIEQPKDENELILPAREGTLRVLQAAAQAGVKRVVQTSSVAAIQGGHSDPIRTFTEADWSDLNGEIAPYAKSKTVAELAAWDFLEQRPGGHPFELAVINPSFVLGPLLDEQSQGTSVDTIKRLMTGGYPGTARISWTVVDVRDVANAHLQAMIQPQAAGNRYICAGEFMWFAEIANILHQHFAERGYKIPTRPLPDWIVKTFARMDKSVQGVVSLLGQEHRLDNSKIKEQLGVEFRSAEETITAMGESLIHLGIV